MFINKSLFKYTFFYLFLIVSLVGCSGKSYTSADGEKIFTSSNDLREEPRLASYYVEPPITIEDTCWNVTDFDYQLAGISMESYPKIDVVVYKRKFSRSGNLDFYLHPIICNGMVYDINDDSNIDAYKLEDKKVRKLWSEKILDVAEKKNISISQARLEDNVLYITTNNGFIVAFDVENKKTIWKKHFEAIFNSSPTIYNNKLFLISSKDDVYAINKEDGKVLWKFESEKTTKSRTYQIPPVAVFQEKVVAGLSNGELVVLDLDGKLIWKQKIYPAKNEGEDIMDIDFPPIIYNNVLVAGGNRTSVMGFDFKTGTPIWQIPTGLNSYMLLNNQGFGFFVSKDNENICFVIENGMIKWVKPSEHTKTTKIVGYLNKGKNTKTQTVNRYFDSY